MKSITFFSKFLLIGAFLCSANLAHAGSVILSWDANTETDLAGYKIYYDTVSRQGDCTAYENSLVIPKDAYSGYTINDLTVGETYYFQLTAVDTSGNESECSEAGEISAVITENATADNTSSNDGSVTFGNDDTINGGNIISAGDNDSTSLKSNLEIKDDSMYRRLKGKILLKVQDDGRAYYVNPQKQMISYLGRPNDAFRVMREQGIGIKNRDLEKIPLSVEGLTGSDRDGDGLPDTFEEAIGTDMFKKDTDGDSYPDKTEIATGHNPKGAGNLNLNTSFTSSQTGKIFIQVESRGEAWYIYQNKRYYLGRPADAYQVMRALSLGISNQDFNKFVSY